MGIRFRKKLRIFPGFSLNFSKSWISTSLWIRWLGITVWKNGTYLNAGLPWTWIYTRFKKDNSWKSSNNHQNDQVLVDEYIPTIQFDEIKSTQVWTMSDEIWLQILQDIKEAHDQNRLVKNEILLWQIKWIWSFILKILSYVFIFWFYYKGLTYLNKDCWGIVWELKDILKNTKVVLDINFDSKWTELYNSFVRAYTELTKISKIWDVTGSAKNDGIRDRSWASNIIDRKLVSFWFKKLEFIECDYLPFHLKNANWSDVFIYPCHIVIWDKKKFDILSLLTPNINFKDSQFIESEWLPKDATVLYKTRKKVNKDGTPDKRFKGNYQIPVAHYTEFSLHSESGLNERYMFSNFEVSLKFANILKEYLQYTQ